jgi:hypothetical protein
LINEVAMVLTNSQMGINTGIASSSCQVLVLPVGNVQMALGVTVLLGKTKVDDVHLVATLADTHQEVIGFDITVNEVLGMDVFDAGDLYSHAN